MTPPIPENKAAAIKQALFEGRKIEAIKSYRDATGAGLAEAKEAVEKMEQELRVASPQEFKNPERKAAGCGAASVLIFSIMVVALIAWHYLGAAR